MGRVDDIRADALGKTRKSQLLPGEATTTSRKPRRGLQVARRGSEAAEVTHVGGLCHHPRHESDLFKALQDALEVPPDTAQLGRHRCRVDEDPTAKRGEFVGRELVEIG